MTLNIRKLFGVAAVALTAMVATLSGVQDANAATDSSACIIKDGKVLIVPSAIKVIDGKSYVDASACATATTTPPAAQAKKMDFSKVLAALHAANIRAGIGYSADQVTVKTPDGSRVTQSSDGVRIEVSGGYKINNSWNLIFVAQDTMGSDFNHFSAKVSPQYGFGLGAWKFGVGPALDYDYVNGTATSSKPVSTTTSIVDPRTKAVTRKVVTNQKTENYSYDAGYPSAGVVATVGYSINDNVSVGGKVEAAFGLGNESQTMNIAVSLGWKNLDASVGFTKTEMPGANVPSANKFNVGFGIRF